MNFFTLLRIVGDKPSTGTLEAANSRLPPLACCLIFQPPVGAHSRHAGDHQFHHSHFSDEAEGRAGLNVLKRRRRNAIITSMPHGYRADT